jgi:hypothetical protein
MILLNVAVSVMAALLPDDLQSPEAIPLPPLEIAGQPARAHTQGLEIVGKYYYVTARREDVAPRRALLLRTEGTHWDVWDITPDDLSNGSASTLDHPGGMQSDGRQLWIPVAESVRHGRSIVRVIRMDELKPGTAARAVLEWAVDDHIGALAVSSAQDFVLGANWDTETVYLWNLQGSLQRTFTTPELERRGLGSISAPANSGGLAVQDWKFVGSTLYASGLLKGAASSIGEPESRLFVFDHFPDRSFERQTIRLPVVPGTELAREAMAVHGGYVYFLPEDLGPTNRLFRIGLRFNPVRRQR